MLEVVRSGGVAPTQGTFLEMALENIATGEGVLAKMALVWPVPSI
jgi:hypothetical protein